MKTRESGMPDEAMWRTFFDPEAIHWNYDPTTPRGPSMSIRPRPEVCRQWLNQAGFTVSGQIVNLPPVHYGILA